jgi:hypothetical protein
MERTRAVLLISVLVALLWPNVAVAATTRLTMADCFEGCDDDDTCFLMCGFCATPSLRIFLPAESALACQSVPRPGPKNTVTAVTWAFLNHSAVLHGLYFNDPGPETNSSLCIEHLIRFMPRRDLLQLFQPGALAV